MVVNYTYVIKYLEEISMESFLLDYLHSLILVKERFIPEV